MKLKAAARRFDTCPVYDAYNNALLFKAQVSTFLEASPDGSTAKRRVLSVDPSITPPTHSTINVLNELWVVGDGILDEWRGGAIRASYWMKASSGLFSLVTPGQACSGTVVAAQHGQRDYLKDTVNGVTDAQYDPFWIFHFSKNAVIAKGTLVKQGPTLYRVRTVHLSLEGFKTAQCDEIDYGVISSTFTSTGVYNPVLDTYSAASVTVPSILLDYYKVYEFRTQASPSNLAGDMALIVAKSSVSPVVGQNVVVNSESWRIIAIVSDQDAWSLHIRRG
jgi:hypothetical protein